MHGTLVVLVETTFALSYFKEKRYINMYYYHTLAQRGVEHRLPIFI